MSVVALYLVAGVAVLVGLSIAAARPRMPIGWLVLVHGLSLLVLFGPGHGSLAAAQLMAGAWVVPFGSLAVVGYLLPTGTFGSPRRRTWVWACLAGAILFVIGAAGDRSGFRAEHHGAEPPLTWLPETVSNVIGTIGLVAVLGLIFGSIFAVGSRLRDAAGEERIQLLWLVWGAIGAPVTLVVGWTNHFLLNDQILGVFWFVLGLASLMLPLTIGIAVLRHRLFDIRPVLSRTIAYLLLAAGAIAAYAAVLSLAGRVVGNDSATGLLAAGAVAAMAHPLYGWSHRRIERWVYGYRSEPHTALRLLADRAESADNDGLTQSITITVSEALRVAGVRISAVGELRSASEVTAPLRHGGEHIADLVVDVPPGRKLMPADVALLNELARYAAVLVRSERQGVELRESRSRIVAGREEERRRLRNDLHDGVGPTLVASLLKLTAVETLADVVERNDVIAETRSEIRAAIAEIRRVVDDLRPAAIDEVGLLQAVRQRASALSAQTTFEVSGPEQFPRLPAAVEVAAFRIASEAMTNVARHSSATRARVEFSLDDDLTVMVTDNGPGAAPDASDGVGLQSMRERAAELGGACEIRNGTDGGTVVRAVLPVRQGLEEELPS